jgi:hypothetical protein
VQPSQEWQTGRGLSFQQHHDDRKRGLLYPSVERFVIFEHLPRADALLTHQQDESIRRGDLLRELRRPEATGAIVLGREEHARRRVPGFDAGFKSLRQRVIGGVIAEKPTRH